MPRPFAVAALILIGTACSSSDGDSPEDVQAFCGVVDEQHEFVRGTGGDILSSQRTLREYMHLSGRAYDARPSSLIDEFTTLDESDDRGERQEAADTINGYVSEHCGLDVPLVEP